MKTYEYQTDKSLKPWVYNIQIRVDIVHDKPWLDDLVSESQIMRIIWMKTGLVKD